MTDSENRSRPEEAKFEAEGWYLKDFTVPDQAQRLFQSYSGVGPDEVKSHIAGLRDRAFATHPYPCLGNLRFLELGISTHPSYAIALSRVKEGGTYLDAGCCLGQDLRKLLLDGAPSSSAFYGIDVEPAFFDIGYDLFRDKNRLQATFIATDLTQEMLPAQAEPLKASIDVISAQSLFHIFPLDMQRRLMKNLFKLAKPATGSLIIGRHLGNEKPGDVKGLRNAEKIFPQPIFAHNRESWELLIKECIPKFGQEWEVQIQQEDAPERIKRQPWARPGVVVLLWTITKQ